MSRKVVVQIRLPAALVEEVDKLTKRGFYSNRTEAIADSIRHLLEMYSSEDEVLKIVRLYLEDKTIRNRSINEVGVTDDPEEVRKVILKMYGTDNIDEVIAKTRGRSL